MNKYTLLLVLLMVGVSFPVVAQEEETEPSELLLFRGGNVDLNLTLNLNTLGGSIGTGGMGSLISKRVDNGALNVNSNPALLGYMRKGSITFDNRLPFNSNMNASLNSELLSSINENIATTVDETFDDEAAWTKFPNTYIRPTEVSNLNSGFNSSLISGSFAAPIYDRLTIAGAFSYPTAIDLRMNLTGLSTKLAQEQGTDDVAIRFDVLMNVNLITQMQFHVSSLSAGLGYQILDGKQKLAVGATITRYNLTSVRRLEADLSGLVVVGGADERFFNDPSDPNLNYDQGETNQFLMNAYGEYEDDQLGMRLGLNYEPFHWVNFSLVYNMMPNFSLVGQNTTASAFLPVFVVGDGNDILSGNAEVALDSLKANKPNLTTERDISDIVADGELNLPSSLTFGTDLAMGRHTFVLNASSYFSEFSVAHANSKIGKDLNLGVGFGFDFKTRDQFGSRGWAWEFLEVPIRLATLDIDGLLFKAFGKWTNYSNSYYRFGGNVLLGDGIDTRAENPLQETLGLPLPQSFAIGRQYTIFDRLDVGVSFLSVPDLVFKYTFAIHL